MEVSVREFKAHLSRYLSQAQQGQAVDVTSHRKVVARVVGVPAVGNEGVARLLVGGAAQWGGGKPAGADIRLSPGGRSVAEMVVEDRG